MLYKMIFINKLNLFWTRTLFLLKWWDPIGGIDKRQLFWNWRTELLSENDYLILSSKAGAYPIPSSVQCYNLIWRVKLLCKKWVIQLNTFSNFHCYRNFMLKKESKIKIIFCINFKPNVNFGENLYNTWIYWETKCWVICRITLQIVW